MTTLQNLEIQTIEWARQRGIIANSTPQQQMLKLVSEMGELADNIAKGRDVRDDIGDCLVVLTLIARLSATSLTECFSVAYEDIKDRKGHLNSNGVFIKESDTDPDHDKEKWTSTGGGKWKA
jgi:NTP pyrophosphatase (non-canonical NTP hydrolase)